MKVLSKIDYFKELPFYNSFIEKPKIKHLTNLIYWLNYLFTNNGV